MIKTLVALSILVSFFLIVLWYSEIFNILLQAKGTFIIMMAYMFSPVTVFCIMAEFAHEVIVGILKRL